MKITKMNEEIRDMFMEQPINIIVTLNEDGSPHIICTSGEKWIGDDEHIIFARWQMNKTGENISKDDSVYLFVFDADETKSFQIHGRGKFVDSEKIKKEYDVDFPTGRYEEGLVVEISDIYYGQYGDKTNQKFEG
ncbi:MAG: pyridoxamine 5'-phosphate oxidase family protein [Candidatus Aenigmatarchaeota archaeon]